MSIYKLITILTIANLFVACSTQTQYGNYVFPEGSNLALLYNYRVDVTVDQMNDSRRIRQVNNGAVDQYPSEYFVFFSLNLSLIDYEEGRDALYLSPKRYGDGWLFIESLTIKIDGVKKTWRWDSWERSSDVIYGGTTQESAFLPISLNDLEELINAKEIIARLHGSDYYADIPTMKYIQLNWKSFYNQYVVDANLK